VVAAEAGVLRCAAARAVCGVGWLRRKQRAGRSAPLRAAQQCNNLKSDLKQHNRRSVLLTAGSLPTAALVAGGVLAAAGVVAAAASAAGSGSSSSGSRDPRALIRTGMNKFRANNVEVRQAARVRLVCVGSLT